MPEQTLTERVEIEREGCLEHPYDYHYIGQTICVTHKNGEGFEDRDIAKAAQEAGYQVGDRFKYKIVIEPKK